MQKAQGTNQLLIVFPIFRVYFHTYFLFPLINIVGKNINDNRNTRTDHLSREVFLRLPQRGDSSILFILICGRISHGFSLKEPIWGISCCCQIQLGVRWSENLMRFRPPLLSELQRPVRVNHWPLFSLFTFKEPTLPSINGCPFVRDTELLSVLQMLLSASESFSWQHLVHFLAADVTLQNKPPPR